MSLSSVSSEPIASSTTSSETSPPVIFPAANEYTIVRNGCTLNIIELPKTNTRVLASEMYVPKTMIRARIALANSQGTHP